LLDAFQQQSAPGIPAITDAAAPPVIVGSATLFTAAMRGAPLPELIGMISHPGTHAAANLFDTSVLFQIAFQREEALRLQAAAIGAFPLLRVRNPRQTKTALRVLALMMPGDTQVNTPIDFITNHLDVRLDLLFMRPDGTLPPMVPKHDVMIFCASDPGPALLDRMAQLFQAWPRPVLNDPALLPLLARDVLPRLFADNPVLCCPPVVKVDWADLAIQADTVAGLSYPLLIRPHDSHAGHQLARIESAAAAQAYLDETTADTFYVSQYLDYRSADGMFRKYRVALTDGQPQLCHMAVSEHWMVHYLNAGMDLHADRRDQEAQAMRNFADGFACRHAAAFQALHAQLPFDLFSIDCAELPDGRLLVFEADIAAIIHMMEPPDVYGYKHAHMPSVFEAVGSLLRRSAGAGP
jgi:hypothetical protein